MFLLSKIFTYTLLSPGLFLLLGLLALIFLLKDRRRTAIFLIILNCCLIYILSVKPLGNMLIYPLEASYQYVTTPNVDALIVLGGGVRHATLAGKTVPEDSTLQRLYYAAKIYKHRNVPIIVCGGSPLNREVSESAVMAEVLRDLQIPDDKIHQESLSRNTKENLANIKNYLARQNYKNPGLITSAAHMPRAIQTADSLGLKMTALPCDFKYARGYHWRDFFPDTDCLSFAAIKEYIGLIYYQKILL